MVEMQIKDYSQVGGNQAAILSAVEGIQNGRVLDIGAWNAKDLSNSRALIEMGWSAVLVEPSPMPYHGLLVEYGNHPGVEVICAAVGAVNCLEKFHFSSDALSTNDEASYQKWKSVGGFIGSGWVPMLTPRDLLGQFGPFDFISIDTEGSSVELFCNMLFRCNLPAIRDEQLPKCIVVEHDSRQPECIEAATQRGYRVVLETGENLVFAR